MLLQKATRVFFLTTILASIISMLGCSNDLSRDKAREIIIKSLNYPIPATEPLDIGSKISADQMKLTWLESLKNEGLISYTYHGQNFMKFHVVSVSLTDKGMKYVLGGIYLPDFPAWSPGLKYVNVKIAEKQFVEVTGIRLSGNKNEAVVEYTWKYANFTPFAKGDLAGYDKNKTYKEAVNMQLYDDGWRIIK
jgi:hypothetical protein